MRDVRSYYDRATRRFLKFGHGGGDFLIHRALWGPGVATRTDAMHFVHELLLEEIEAGGFLRVVDLGCGVGGSIRYLAPRYPAEYWGITISETQAKVAESLLDAEARKAHILLGDMAEIGDRLPGTDKKTLYFAIESAIHLSDVSLLFESIRIARSGDCIALIDDTLGRSPTASESRLLARFRKGWRADGLTTRTHIFESADRYGFVLQSARNLSPYLELRRPRDRFIRFVLPLLRIFGGRSAWFSSLIGGDALQRALLSGLIEHFILIFRKL